MCVILGFVVWLLIKQVNYSSLPTSSSGSRNFDEVSTHSRKLNPKMDLIFGSFASGCCGAKVTESLGSENPLELKFRWIFHKWPRDIHTK